MEQEKMKRARERDEETETPSLENSSNNNNKAKRRDLHGINLMKENQQQKKDLEAEKASSKAPAPPPPWDSVFDFPWLKDGVMSKTEEDFFLDFEDKFSSSLIQHEDGFHFSEAYCFCETPEASKMVGETVFESDGLEIKAEDVDCIWSSLIQ